MGSLLLSGFQWPVSEEHGDCSPGPWERCLIQQCDWCAVCLWDKTQLFKSLWLTWGLCNWTGLLQDGDTVSPYYDQQQFFPLIHKLLVPVNKVVCKVVPRVTLPIYYSLPYDVCWSAHLYIQGILLGPRSWLSPLIYKLRLSRMTARGEVQNLQLHPAAQIFQSQGDTKGLAPFSGEVGVL